MWCFPPQAKPCFVKHVKLKLKVWTEPPVEKLQLTPHLYQDLEADPPGETPLKWDRQQRHWLKDATVTGTPQNMVPYWPLPSSRRERVECRRVVMESSLHQGYKLEGGPLHPSAGSASLKFASILFQNCLCASFTIFSSKQLCMLMKASYHHRQRCMPPMLPRTFCQPVLIREDSYFDSLLCSYQFLTQFLEDPVPLQPPFTRTALECGIVHSTNLLRGSQQWDTAVPFVFIRHWGGLRSEGLSCLTAVHGPSWTSYWLPVQLEPERGLLPAGS